jgi:hypothetical protein
VVAALKKVGIDLATYQITITGVYSRETYARPYGFDFVCKNSEKFLGQVSAMSHRALAMRFDDYDAKKPPVFNEDSSDDIGGRISGGVTDGRGFRQIGKGAALHIEIDVKTDKCNVHIDSHGYVVGPGQYDWGPDGAGDHGYWDLGSHYVPGLYPRIGDKGRIGPLIAPVRGPDGERHWILGIRGEY